MRLRPRTAGPRLALATALLAIATGCSSGTNDPITADPGVPAVAISPALSHVHGLAINPDGEVLAGTHNGLFAIDSNGKSRRVGTADDDFMGLSGVFGTTTLYASGHPGPSSSAPNPLGLIISTDGGQTWTAKSRSGESDFHALGAAGEFVAAYDGSTVVTSADGGATWLDGADIEILSMAVFQPSIFAATPDGLQASVDGGATFEPIEGTPSLRLITAAGDGSLWGVDNDGIAWRSRDAQNWEQRALVGSVEAIVAPSFDLAYATTPSELYTLT